MYRKFLGTIGIFTIVIFSGCSFKHEQNYYQDGVKVKSETKDLFKKKAEDEK